MLLYQINLPVLDNRGNRTVAALLEWERLVLERVGGFTRLTQVTGAWRGGDGREYHDLIIPYQIAVENPTQFGDLLAEAFRLFPDQEAIFYASLGRATIRLRAEAGVI